jgi:hypothetical protein
MDHGFIVLHRKILKWEWHDDPKMISLFIHLLLIANHQDSKWHGIEVKRGQLITGRHSLSKITHISEQSIRTLLLHLKSTNEITIKSTNKYSIITIVKYDDYQSNKNNQPSNQPSNQQTINQQSTTNNNDNNDNKLIYNISEDFKKNPRPQLKDSVKRVEDEEFYQKHGYYKTSINY